MRYETMVSFLQNLPATDYPAFFNRMNVSSKAIIREQFRRFLSDVLSTIPANNGILFLRAINQYIENVDWTNCDYLQITRLLPYYRYGEFFRIVGNAGIVKALPDFARLYVFLEQTGLRDRNFLFNAIAPFLSHIKITALELQNMLLSFPDIEFILLKFFRKQLPQILLQFLILENLSSEWVYYIIKKSFIVLLFVINFTKDCPSLNRDLNIYKSLREIDGLAFREMLSLENANIYKFIKLYEFVRSSIADGGAKQSFYYELIGFFGDEFFSKMFCYLQPTILDGPLLPPRERFSRRSSTVFPGVRIPDISSNAIPTELRPLGM